MTTGGASLNVSVAAGILHCEALGQRHANPAIGGWLGDQDSNLGWRSQSPQSYR